jgi:hypothetical protein
MDLVALTQLPHLTSLSLQLVNGDTFFSSGQCAALRMLHLESAFHFRILSSPAVRTLTTLHLSSDVGSFPADWRSIFGNLTFLKHVIVEDFSKTESLMYDLSTLPTLHLEMVSCSKNVGLDNENPFRDWPSEAIVMRFLRARPTTRFNVFLDTTTLRSFSKNVWMNHLRFMYQDVSYTFPGRFMFLDARPEY